MPRRKPTTEEKERLKRGIQARNEALNALMDRHRDEFERLHAEKRLSLGLPARSAGPSRAQLEERIRKQREKLAKWEEELRIAG